MSFENQDFGSRPRRQRYETYGSPPRSRPREYIVEEKSRKPVYRDEGRPRYRDYNDITESRPPRKDFRERRSSGGPSRRSDAPTRPSKVLGVFGLSIHTTERDLYNIFSSYGRVQDIQMVFDHLSGRSRGFAFVYYESTEDAQRAKTSCEGGLDIDGKIARVDYSLTTAPHNPTPGIYMGKSRDRPDNYRNGGRPYERPRGFADYRDRGDYRDRPSKFSRGGGGDVSRYEEERRSHRSARDRTLIDGGREPPVRSSRPTGPPDDGHMSGGRRRRRTLSSSRSRSTPPVYATSGGRKSSDVTDSGPRRSGNSGGKVIDEVTWSDE